ncbi:ABC transporter ATP-binding protein [Simplicispira hankyongi]|uniref:ABC transporter ATP-binding protein n=1 Tax=Simplicispira hankyongi TaxID=2315688 RepID=A0A398C6J1_9BURK|nr:ABC transporter ATP-binding protein [Simplicispira hankyongi]RID98622.1 ABC transporter ATP-binding protein [Simplicispira hankyongi]
MSGAGPEGRAVAAVVAPAAAPVLRVLDLGKEYKLYPTPRARLKALVTGRATHRSHWALQGVSFELARGQCIGVIGDNGAGKSSLLKLLAGTLQPSVGRIERVGRVTAILELGAGFHPDFSGRDNLYFGGSLIGIGREEMAALEPGIVEFSELGEAMDRPVKTYSSGMAVRLAFALVTAVQPDVLIIDEALAVGDQHFQKKCIERILAFRNSGCTILFCSHSPYHIRHLCDQALWLDSGRVRQFGETEAVLGAYDVHTRLRNAQDGSLQADTATAAQGAAAHDAANAQLAAETRAGEIALGAVAAARLAAGEPVESASAPPPSAAPATAVQDAGSARILDVRLADLRESLSDGEPGLLDSRDLVVTISARGWGAERPNIGFMIEQSQGVGITSLATHEEGAAPQRQPDGTWRSVLTFPKLPLHSGDYMVSAFLFDESGLVVYDQWFQFLHFRFVSPTLMPGLVRLPHEWH